VIVTSLVGGRFFLNEEEIKNVYTYVVFSLRRHISGFGYFIGPGESLLLPGNHLVKWKTLTGFELEGLGI